MSIKLFFVLIGRDFYRARYSFLLAVIFAALTCAVMCLLWIRRERKHGIKRPLKSNMFNIAKKFLLFFYLALVMCLTCLARESGSRGGVNLKLFSTWTGDTRSHTFFIENILLFVPIGMLLAWNFRMLQRARICIATGFLMSLLIEIIQLITARGFFEIDDILTNVIGCALGWGTFKGIQCWQQRNKRTAGRKRAKNRRRER